MRHLFLTAAAITLGACGPLLVPMIPRPTAEVQVNINHMWSNVLSPPTHTDRTLLLGVLMAYDLYANGVDRADFHSEKTVDGKRVIMDVHYQRELPDDDSFYVTEFDAQGRVVRQERYSRADVENERETLTHSQMAAIELASTQPFSPDRRFELLEEEKHWELIQAATMPAPAQTQPAATHRN